MCAVTFAVRGRHFHFAHWSVSQGFAVFRIHFFVVHVQFWIHFLMLWSAQCCPLWSHLQQQWTSLWGGWCLFCQLWRRSRRYEEAQGKNGVTLHRVVPQKSRWRSSGRQWRRSQILKYFCSIKICERNLVACKSHSSLLDY